MENLFQLNSIFVWVFECYLKGFSNKNSIFYKIT